MAFPLSFFLGAWLLAGPERCAADDIQAGGQTAFLGEAGD